MACFVVPVAEAIITTVISKSVKKKESNSSSAQNKIPFSRKISWLSNLLWGGSALLAFEHLWHGEIVPWFPFLTAASNTTATAEMLHEMSTVGVSMSVLTTFFWIIMLIVAKSLEKRNAVENQLAEAGAK